MKKNNMASFVEGADQSLFPLQNCPYGVFKRKNENNSRIGVAIGDYVLDLACLENKGLLKTNCQQKLFNQNTLNAFAREGSAVWTIVRDRIQTLLSIDNTELQSNADLLAEALIPQHDIEMSLPFKIEGFTDFYASLHHATNVGKLFRGKENALLPNWKHLPVAYNGRASTVFLSDTKIIRPKGQIKLPHEEFPFYAPTNKLDFEVEMGIFIGVGNSDGTRISVDDASSHLFGVVLLNDWSARDIQAFEYQPLGPFLSKSFATSISPWVVPFAALNDCMLPISQQDPQPVSYLQQSTPKQPNIKFKVELKTKSSKDKTVICETNATELYWSIEQMLAHHTVNHCIMKPGDLLGSGTISGPNKENWGSLLEITLNGTQPLRLPGGHERKFLEDGDTIIITGYVTTEDYQLGLGSVSGTIYPAVD